MQSNRHGHQQFVCSVGHAFTLGTLYQAKEEELERAQWSATVLMEHRDDFADVPTSCSHCFLDP